MVTEVKIRKLIVGGGFTAEGTQLERRRSLQPYLMPLECSMRYTVIDVGGDMRREDRMRQ